MTFRGIFVDARIIYNKPYKNLSLKSKVDQQDFTFFRVKFSQEVLKTYPVEKEDSTFIFFSLPRRDGLKLKTRENLMKKRFP